MDIKKQLKNEFPDIEIDLKRVKSNLSFSSVEKRKSPLFYLKPLILAFSSIVLIFVVVIVMYNASFGLKSSDMVNADYEAAPASDPNYQYEPGDGYIDHYASESSGTQNKDDMFHVYEVSYKSEEKNIYEDASPAFEPTIPNASIDDDINPAPIAPSSDISNLSEQKYYLITTEEELNKTFDDLNLEVKEFKNLLKDSYLILVNGTILNEEFDDETNTIRINVSENQGFNLLTFEQELCDLNALNIEVEK